MLTDNQKNTYKQMDYHDLNFSYIKACLSNDINSVRYLLTSNDLPQKANIHHSDDCGFTWAIQHGHVEIIDYLLTSSELSEHVNFNEYKENIFKLSCMEGHLSVIRYLLNSPTLKEQININEIPGYQIACQYQHYDIIYYLLFSSELSHHIEIAAYDNLAFRTGLKQKSCEFLRSLIFEHNLAITPQMESYMKNFPEVQNLFKEREITFFKEKLDNNLHSLHKPFSKYKI